MPEHRRELAEPRSPALGAQCPWLWRVVVAEVYVYGTRRRIIFIGEAAPARALRRPWHLVVAREIEGVGGRGVWRIALQHFYVRLPNRVCLIEAPIQPHGPVQGGTAQHGLR